MFMWLRSLGRELRARLTGPERPDIFRLPVVVRAKSGIRVDEDSALRYSAVWAAVSYISQTIAGLSWRVYRRQASGGKVEQPNEPAATLLHNAPNHEITPFTFRETMLAHTLTWGNGYAEIERNNAGTPLALWPITPDRVCVDRDLRGNIIYVVSQSGVADVALPASKVFHLRGLGFDGLVGYSVIQMAAESIGLGLGTEQFGSSWFGGGSKPAGVFTHPKALGDKARARLKESFADAKSGRTLILEDGMSWQQIGIPPEDAQFLETRKFQVSEISRWYGVPPHKLGDLEKATFSNITEQQIEAVQDCILPWAIRLEQEANAKLLPAGRHTTLYTKINLAGLLRGDMKTRYEAYKTGMLNGWLSPDEIRELEDMNPLPRGQGKVYLVPMNEIPLDQIGKEPERKPVPAEPDPEPTDPKPDPTEPRHVDFGPLLLDYSRRLVRQEANRIESAAKKFRSAEAFRSWLAEFYVEFVGHAIETFTVPLQTIADGDIEAQHGAIRATVAQHVAQATERAIAAHKAGEIGEWASQLEANRPGEWANELLAFMATRSN